MLHLARKAFFPGKLPFPVMHVDTRWKFQEMYRFRDRMVEEMGLDLITTSTRTASPRASTRTPTAARTPT